MDLVQRQAAAKCLCNVAPIAKFAAEQVILPTNVMFRLFQYRVRPGEKCCPTTKSTKLTKQIFRDRSACVFVPFVAIPGNGPAAEFCKRLNSSIRLLVFIRVNSWFVVPLRGYLFLACRSTAKSCYGLTFPAG
ncbi:MAG: hypothetical protein OXG96_14715 [Acidobacteria bacterium]|nr:hypothetical protein [Acidobacteriota bacterium]